MGSNVEGLIKYSRNKKEKAIQKVDEAIRNLSVNGNKINFNTVSKESGVSKGFLYKEYTIKTRIEELRNKQINHEINQRANSCFENNVLPFSNISFSINSSIFSLYFNGYFQ